MNTSLKDTILLIEIDPDIRNHILNAARTEKRISKVITAESLMNGLKMLRSDQGGDIIIISHHFDPKEIQEFVAAAKNTPLGRDAAIITMVKSNDSAKTSMAQHFLRGVDGFLALPFTIEMVQSSIDAAVKVKHRKLIYRVAVASRLILSDFVKQLDYAAYDAKFRNIPIKMMPGVAESASVFRYYKDTELKIYFQIMIEMFTNTNSPREYLNSKAIKKSVVKSEGITPSGALRMEASDADWQKRLKALEQIIGLGSSAKKYMSELLVLAKDPNSTCRRRAKLALLKLKIIE